MAERAVAVHTIGGKVSSYNPMTEEEMDDAMRHCTDAQLRILHLASKSHTPKEICNILNIKIATLTRYRKGNRTFHNLLNNKMVFFVKNKLKLIYHLLCLYRGCL